ncbi:MAG: catechol 2,3-dioxygenase [Fimbriimonadaceae bacterium]|jgi:catechol 2,3-dioxygenase|nr:catechol 2,3-dioxygenase [Fimbriimonadaceae bacterium]
MATSIDPRTKIGPVALKVADLARSEQFYSDVLGMQALERGSGTLTMGAAGISLLELEERPGARPKPTRATGLYHFAILVPSREALGLSLRRLAETEYPLQGAADHLVSEALYLPDPDGSGIEIYRDRPREEWTFREGQVEMATDPLDLESLLREAGDQPFSGLPTETTMGHVHLHVRDLAEAEAFYRGLLGFDMMLRWPPSALFMSAGGYHHHIGLNTWAGVGAPPPPEDAAGLKHFTIELPDRSTHDSTVDRLRAAGVPVQEDESGALIRDPSQNGILLRVA